MNVLNYGSLNIDYVYNVDHIAAPGETILTSDRNVFCGGKGLNQTIALAKSGAGTYHAGMVGEEDGGILLDALEEAEADDGLVQMIPGNSGHTIIQVDKNGENAILLFGGSNQKQTKKYIDEVFEEFEKDDVLLLQNEVNLLDYLIEKGHAKGMKVVLNPAPYNEKIEACDLEKVSLLILNEVEGKQMTGKTDPDDILAELTGRFPHMEVLLTLGVEGATYQYGEKKVHQDSFPAQVVDTTAAGDTFVAYYVSAIMDGQTVEQSLEMAAKAAAICVSRPGAGPSIPTIREVMTYLR